MDINKLLEEVKSKNVNVKPKGNGTDINALLEEIKYNAPTTNINLSSIYNQSLKTINEAGLKNNPITNKNNPIINKNTHSGAGGSFANTNPPINLESPLNNEINLESLFNQSIKTISNDGSKGKQTIQLPPTQTPEMKQQLFKASMEQGLQDNSYFADPNYDFEGYKKYYDSLPFIEKVKANAQPLEIVGKYAPEKYGKMLSDAYNEDGIGGDVGAGAYKGILGFKEAARGWGNAITGDLGGSSNYFKESPLDKPFLQARSELMDNRSFIRNLPENLSMVGTQLLPTLATGGTAGIAIAAANAGGQNTQQALDSGATPWQATGHGFITGTTEALLERALGFKFGSAGSKVATKSALKFTGDAARNAKSIAKEFLKKSAGEGLEEVLINPVTQASKKLLYDDSVSVNMNPYAENNAYGPNGLFPLKQMWDDGRLGAIMGGILSGVNIPNQVQYAKMIEQDMGKNFEVDLSIGLNMPETSQSYEIANQLANQNFDTVTEESYSNYKKVLGEDIQTLNKVAQENVTVPQNMQNITESPINQQEMQPNLNETIPQLPELDLTQSQLQDIKTSSQVIESPLNQNVVSQNQAPVANISENNNLPMNERNFSEVGNKKVNAYQYENPDVKPYYQSLANLILNEEFISAEKGFSGELNRSMQGDVMKKLKETGLSYKDIKSGLELIIKDEGSENVARSKKVEVVLDDLISNGFKLKDGTKLNPDTDYLKIKSQIDNTQYVEPNINNDLPVMENNNARPTQNNIVPPSPTINTESINPSTPQPMSNFKPESRVDSLGIASNEIELAQQIKQGDLSWDLQRFAEEKLDRIKKLSKFYTNTIENNPEISEDEKKMFKKAIKEYDLVSEKESLAEAKQRLDRDFEGEVYELSEKESFADGVDFDTSMGILSVYKEEGRKTGDYSKFKDWSKMIQVKASTSAGQIVQAHAKYSRTPEGILRGSQKLIDNIEKDIKENNPNKIKDIEEQTDAVDEIVKEVNKQAEKDISDEIAKDEELTKPKKDKPSDTNQTQESKNNKPYKNTKKSKQEKEEDDVANILAERIIRNTNKLTNPKVVEKSVIDMMVDELYLKHKEVLPDEVKISLENKYKEIAKAIKERDIASETWVQAKKIVKEKFKDNAKAQAILDKYFGTGTRPPFSQKLLNETVKDAMGKLNIKLSDMVNEYYSKGKKQRGELVKHIIDKSGLDGKDAEVLTRYVQAKIKEMKKQYSEKYLETAFKEKLPPVKKDGKVIKDIEALFNNGAFDNEKYSSRVIDKLNAKLRLQLKRSGVNMTESAKSSIKNKEFKSDIFLGSIRGKIELSEADEATLVSVAQDTFNEVLEEYKDRILNNKFKVKDKAIKKSMQSKVMELINLDAYSRENIRDAIKEKEGLPVLNNDDIGKILNLAEIAESQDSESGINQLANTVINTIMANKIPVKTRDKALALLRNNMLSAATSHAKNISSNLIFNAPIVGIENFKDYYVGAFIDMATSKVLGMERDVLFSPITKTKGQVKGFTKGVKRLKDDFTASRSNVDTLTKRFIDEGLNEEMAKNFAKILAPEKPSENLKGYDKFKDHKRYLFEKINGKYNNIDTSKVSLNYDLRNSRIFKSDALNTYDSYVKTFLRFGDVPFYEAAKEMRMAELKKIKKTDVATEEMNLDAELFALETVFQNNSDIRQRVVKIKEALGIVGDVMLPFTQTPSNLFDKLIDYTPAGMVRGLRELGNVKNGTFNKKLFVDRLSRSLTGTSAIVLFGALSQLGILSLTGATDRREKANAMQKTQFQRYSIKLKLGDEDYYFSYESFPPIGSLMAIAATMNEEIKSKGMSWDAILKGAYASGDMLINNSMLQGFLSLVSNFNLAGSMTKTLENSISQTNPNVFKRLTKTLDPWVRETYDPSKFKQGINKYIAGIPFLSETLPKKVDIFGKETQWNNGLNNTFFMMFFPITTTKFKPTEVQKEIYDIFSQTDDVGVLPNVADDTLNYVDSKGIKQPVQLDTEQYIKYQRLMGEYVQGRVSDIMKNQQYIDNSNKFGYKYKVKVLSSVMRDSKDIAQNTILKEILNKSTEE